VSEDSTVATVMAEKSEYDIPSPASGMLRIKTRADQALTPGKAIVTVE
jgi:pyruvate/2-oxoglutarate dehydrogenase complex dihydrolipoamide acyltransferase (E2) component